MWRIKLGATAATSALLKLSRPRGQNNQQGGSTSPTPAAKAVDAAASSSVVVEFETGVVEEKWLLQGVVSRGRPRGQRAMSSLNLSTVFCRLNVKGSRAKGQPELPLPPESAVTAV